LNDFLVQRDLPAYCYVTEQVVLTIFKTFLSQDRDQDQDITVQDQDQDQDQDLNIQDQDQDQDL